jgi:hypothetical protein
MRVSKELGIVCFCFCNGFWLRAGLNASVCDGVPVPVLPTFVIPACECNDCPAFCGCWRRWRRRGAWWSRRWLGTWWGRRGLGAPWWARRRGRFRRRTRRRSGRRGADFIAVAARAFALTASVVHAIVFAAAWQARRAAVRRPAPVMPLR